MTASDPRKGLPSASSLERRYMCPGSQAAEAEFPEEEPSPVAAAGTRIHLALYKKEMEDLELDEKEVAVKLSEMEADIVAKWRNEYHLTEDMECFREKRCWLWEEAATPSITTTTAVCSAQPDVVYVGYDRNTGGYRLLLINYKTGFKNVAPASINWQCKTEAVCVASQMQHESPARMVIASLRVAVIQFRLKGYTTQAEYTDPDLLDATDDVLDVLHRASMPDAPRAAGQWCQYCRAAAHCPQSAAMSLLPLHMKNTTLQDAKAIYLKRKLIVDILDKVTARLKGESPTALQSVGLTLTMGRELKSVQDAAGLFKLLQEHGFADLESFIAWGKFSHAQIHGYLLERFSKSMRVDAAEELIGEMLKPYLEVHRSQPSLKLLK